MKNLKEMTDQEIQELIQKATEELESRKPKNLIAIDWTGVVQDIRKGKPYFAVLTNDNGQLKYNYLSTIMYEGKKFNATATAVFRGELPEGTVVRYRESASWKNDYSYYAVVTQEGLKKITEIEAKRLLGIIK
ncbi:MAG: hypothetical protein RBR14_06580 [Candidatus Cloacimonas acidaminovorans]|nr:hypothetical protein [Candidatus Cloacimonas acidaminovorans]